MLSSPVSSSLPSFQVVFFPNAISTGKNLRNNFVQHTLYEVIRDKTSGYFIKAGELKKEADRLQLESEETSDEKIKVEKLAEAYKKLELANMYS